MITSAARLPSRMMRRTVSRAPSTFGGIASNIHRQVLGIGDNARERLVDLMSDRRGECAQGRHPRDARELGSGPVQRFLGDPGLRHILKGTDEHGPTGNSLDDMSDAPNMLHGAALAVTTRNAKLTSTPVMARATTDSNAGRSSGWMTSRTRLHCDLGAGVELEDPVSFLGPVVIVPIRSVMKLPVLLNRWASAKLSYARRSSASACFRSSMSVLTPYHLTIVPV